jgi:hypothetical protein
MNIEQAAADFALTHVEAFAAKYQLPKTTAARLLSNVIDPPQAPKEPTNAPTPSSERSGAGSAAA